MAIMIGKYEFDGPYESVDFLEEAKGVFVVLHRQGDEYELIHAAEADNVREFISVSQAASRTTGGTVTFAVCYTPECKAAERRSMVAEILAELDDDKSEHENIDRAFAQTAQ